MGSTGFDVGGGSFVGVYVGGGGEVGLFVTAGTAGVGTDGVGAVGGVFTDSATMIASSIP